MGCTVGGFVWGVEMGERVGLLVSQAVGLFVGRKLPGESLHAIEHPIKQEKYSSILLTHVPHRGRPLN